MLVCLLALGIKDWIAVFERGDGQVEVSQRCGRYRLRVRRPSIEGPPFYRSRQSHDGERLHRTLKQIGNIVEALVVLHSHGLALVRDGPHITFFPKDVIGRRRTQWNRHRRWHSTGSLEMFQYKTGIEIDERFKRMSE